jgi:hypothetical protein
MMIRKAQSFARKMREIGLVRLGMGLRGGMRLYEVNRTRHNPPVMTLEK